MNRNITPLLLIILAIGVYFTYTSDKIDEAKAVKVVNDQYTKAIEDSEDLIAARDRVLLRYNNLSDDDKDRLEKLVPDNMDNVRLIIDVNTVAARHSIMLKNVKTTNLAEFKKAENNQNQTDPSVTSSPYNTMTFSFDIKSNYKNFVNFMQDLEKSLRIIEVSKIELKSGDSVLSGIYDFSVEVKTFWLKQ